ncbi:nuclear transport factor 2 family protein [Amycolatopsis cynarae]|uniref:Nuclear transport factor 2 family protein n=1 Tax=Amycolatopsis cynarae TaxID=2995223 RepID=A0ABY7B9F1_9PSEU|nr:nuclear transport factor 2 family protein [Amycolatopsis sp. HUAS 11-8]WAL68585.1 nuclear transport factor 2 family protein [Amycolatopsis sp. HUAS 11-8]
MHFSPAQAFHHRWCAAMAARDTTALRELYHPDAVQLSVATSQVLTGAQAIASGYAELFGSVGAVQTTAVESFVDLGEAFVAESTQQTGFLQMTGYDVFALVDGRARFHVHGAISPRPPAALPPESGAPGQAFYRRVWAATNARDAAALQHLYAPDAVMASTAGVVRGLQAITTGIQQVWQSAGPAQLKGLSRFVEGPDALAVEGVANIGLMEARLDVEFYEVWLLRAGQATLTVTGLINPRPAELRQGLQRLAEHRTRVLQTFAEGVTLRASAPWRW